MERVNADHVVYGMKKYDEGGKLKEARFYTQPTDEETFQKTAARLSLIMMYDTKNGEYVTAEIMKYGIQRKRLEIGDFQTRKAAFERLARIGTEDKRTGPPRRLRGQPNKQAASLSPGDDLPAR